MSDSDSRVTVAVRIRPKLENVTNATQVAERYHPEAAMKVSETTVRLSTSQGKETKTNVFSFDHVFDRDCTQQEVYEDTTVEAIDAALGGCNATVMTYGQTGSGKTYTVLGSVRANPLSDDVLTQDTGLFLRVLKDILNYAEARSSQLHLTICLSVLEIYLESVRDLLSERPADNMKMVIDGENVHLPELTYIPITQVRDAIDAYKVATGRRVSRATEANDQSSRSHALFSIEIFQQRRTEENPEPLSLDELIEMRRVHARAQAEANAPKLPSGRAPTGAKKGIDPIVSPVVDGNVNAPFPCPNGLPAITCSRIVLTDLAGSEKMKHSNAKGESFEEMKKINGSLTALGNVVHSLHSGAKHIPYRDSKLTLLLRSSFSAPNARVVMIANMSPTSLTYDETLSTLFFADKVKAMKAASVQNVDIKTETEYLGILRSAEELGAEMRVLKETNGYTPQLRKTGAAKPDSALTKRELNLLLPSTSADAKKARDRAIKSEIVNPLVAAKDTDAEARKADREGEGVNLHAQLVKELIEDFNKAVASLHEKVDKQSAEMKSDAAEATDYHTEQAGQVAAEEKAGLAVSQDLTARQERKTALPKLITDAKATQKSLDEKYEEMERKFMAENKDVEDAWKAQQAKFARGDRQHEIATGIRDGCGKYWGQRGEFIDARMETLQLYDEGTVLQKEVEIMEVSDWIRRAMITIGNNAVTLSLKAQAKARIPKIRPPASAPGGKRPPGEEGAGTPSSPNRPGVPNPNSPKSRPKAPAKSQVSLYDSVNLLSDIQTYMANGTTMLKHGRSGQPHYRFFYVLHTEESCRLCWEQEDTGRREGTGSSVNLLQVTKIVLGQSSQVFLRSRRREDFLTSFTLHYIKKQEPRTLDVVCETDAEFEAWIIGLCQLCRLDPIYEEQMVGANGMDGGSSLSIDEAELCSTWHIPPKCLAMCKRRLPEIAARRRQPIAKLTPGDIRFIAQVDVFRASALWSHLAMLKMVEPPNPTTMRHYLEITNMPTS